MTPVPSRLRVEGYSFLSELFCGRRPQTSAIERRLRHCALHQSIGQVPQKFAAFSLPDPTENLLHSRRYAKLCQ
jgi:hypothetical protein